MAKEHTLLTDLLTELGVPHTDAYSIRRFASMPFNTLFGLSKLLQEYGVEGQAFRLPSTSDLSSVPTPFLLQTPKGFVIVRKVDGDRVDYVSQGVAESIPLDDIRKVMTGVIFVPVKKESSKEPDFASHKFTEIGGILKKWMLWIGLALLFAYFFVTRRIYAEASSVVLTVFSLAGLYFSFLLIQKSIGVKNSHTDRFCGALEKGGCDQILKMKASSFFGIISWSDVGLGYFLVTLAVILVWPQYIPYIALFNVCCLPFTCWSIWYQRFRAHHWCTLCVSVQCTLWLLFFTMLWNGALARLHGLGIQFFAIGVGYVTTVLLISAVTSAIKKRISNEQNT